MVHPMCRLQRFGNHYGLGITALDGFHYVLRMVTQQRYVILTQSLCLVDIFHTPVFKSLDGPLQGRTFVQRSVSLAHRTNSATCLSHRASACAFSGPYCARL